MELSQKHACPSCGGAEASIFLDRCIDRVHDFPGEWSLVECRECRLVYRIPLIPSDDLVRFYPDNYASYQCVRPLRENGLLGPLRKILILPYTLRFGSTDWESVPFGEGRLLDIGCGSGALLKRMANLGWQCFGIDFSEHAVGEARRNVPGAVIAHQSIEQFTLPFQFDVITAFHVIEHINDPRRTLLRIHELLAPGGLLVLGLPNRDSWEAKLFGRCWRGLDVPRHVVHFTESDIQSFLTSCGFKIVSVRPAMFASSISESVIMMLPPAMRRRVTGSTLARLLYLSTVFLAAVSYAVGNRGNLEIVAAKT
jgi:SAM-dependent methyltransferase